ncbi:lytic murein transglycosylase [Oricola indica]|jgi:lytic murein transglycosylase|uniref:lytic murein transglycosylase n=1 Tax=Oricola indica TaxID=2872591 RepID=UPI003D17513D
MKSRLARLALGVVVATAMLTGVGHAAQCGNNAGGFERWKAQFAAEAKANGIRNRGLQALAGTRYATKTIHADRNQKSFRYSLQKFMQVRGSSTIISQGRRRKASNASFFSAIERKYGVPAGPLLAIHGMETGFGRFMGNANVVSAIATLAYDCRRSAFFTEHLYAALQLVDRGVLSSKTRGAMHGEVGHTQFLPGSVLRYGVDGDGNGRVDLAGSQWDALASTANFLRAHGWRRGAGYQPGQANFRAIQGWNAAGVYQKAIAIMAAEIDK